MPNNVINQLTIMGNLDEVLSFFAAVKGPFNDFSLQAALPLPEELNGSMSPPKIVTTEELKYLWEVHRVGCALDKFRIPVTAPHAFGMTQETSNRLMDEYGANNWYDWCMRNWGCKWDVYDVEPWNVEGNTATIRYVSANTPLSVFLLNISVKFPSLMFFHMFAGADDEFVGTENIMNGEIVDAENYEYNSPRAMEIKKSVGIEE